MVKNNTKKEPIEKQLWKAADKLRKNIDAAEYKHIILGLIFLKYKANMPVLILKIEMNIRLRMFFLCRLLPAGFICNQRLNCRK